MKQNAGRIGLSRRDLLRASAGAAVSLAAGPAFADHGMMETAVSAARRIAAGRDITLKILLPNGSKANIDPVIAEFLQQTGISVTTQEVTVDEINLQLSLDNMSGASDYDLALPATYGLPDLVQEGAITPLTHFVDLYESPSARTDMLYQIGDSFDGETYGFQTDGDAYIMFYHHDMLRNSDEKRRYEDRFATALDTPLTWKELDRQMAWFHRPDQGQYGGLLFRTQGFVAWEWWVRFHAGGRWPLSPDLTPQLVSDEGIGALEDMIHTAQFLAPEAATAGLFENWQRYARGDIFANIGWGGSQKHFNRADSPVKGRLCYGTTPGGMVGDELLVTPYFNWGWNYVVTSNAAEPELAYLFALFAASPEMSTIAVRQADGFFDPFRSEHYDDPGIQAAYSKPFLKVHRESMSRAIPDLYLARQSEYFMSLSEWIPRALSGKVTPEHALLRIEQQWNIISNETGRAQQARRWRALRAKYPKQAQALLRDLS